MKTIDINAKECNSKGNSYFSARITLDYGLETQSYIVLPWQYGYGNAFEHRAFEELHKLGLISDKGFGNWFQLARDLGIIVRSNIDKQVTQKQVREWGTRS